MNRPAQLTMVPDIATLLLNEEGPGILNWAVEGAVRHQEKNHQYQLTEDQKANVRRVVDASDSVGLFVAQKLMLDPDGDITVESLFEAYEEFADEHDLQKLSKGVLGRKLKPLIQTRLHLMQRNDIMRPAFGGPSAHRGYKGLVLVP